MENQQNFQIPFTKIKLKAVNLKNAFNMNKNIYKNDC